MVEGSAVRVWFVDPDRSLGFVGLADVAERAGLEVAGHLDRTTDPGPRRCDLVMSDPARSGQDELPPVSEDCRHIAVTHRRDEPFVLRVLRAGYEGFLLYATPEDEAVDALQRLARGDAVVATDLASRVAISGARLSENDFWPGKTHGLTRRESQVLDGVSHGCSTREIAERLFVGEETVRSHLKSLYQKLGVSDRSAAVAHAFREGILSPDAG